MESRHCGQDKRIFLRPVHNASTPCSLQAFGIRCILITLILDLLTIANTAFDLITQMLTRSQSWKSVTLPVVCMPFITGLK